MIQCCSSYCRRESCASMIAVANTDPCCRRLPRADHDDRNDCGVSNTAFVAGWKDGAGMSWPI
eukprot:scaffold7493_cov58-Cyclotella_meneghiniana.AAC.6